MAANLYHDCKIIVKMPCGAAVQTGDMVVLNAATVIPIADSCITGLFGVAMETGATGELIAVGRNGTWRFTAASDLAPGALAYASGAQAVDHGTAADHNVGIVVDSDPAATGDIFIQITPLDICPTTHHA